MQWRIALCLNTSLDAYIHVPWAEWKAIWSQKKQNVNVFMKLLGQIYVTEHYETNGKVHLSHHRLLSSCPVWTLHRHVLLQNFQLRIYILSVPTLTVPSAQLRCNLLLPLSSSHQLIPSIHPLGTDSCSVLYLCCQPPFLGLSMYTWTVPEQSHTLKYDLI